MSEASHCIRGRGEAFTLTTEDRTYSVWVKLQRSFR